MTMKLIMEMEEKKKEEEKEESEEEEEEEEQNGNTKEESEVIKRQPDIRTYHLGDKNHVFGGIKR